MLFLMLDIDQRELCLKITLLIKEEMNFLELLWLPLQGCCTRITNTLLIMFVSQKYFSYLSFPLINGYEPNQICSYYFDLKTEFIFIFVFLNLGVVHEHPRIGSDGESEEASGASDEVISPVTNSHYIPNNNVSNGNVRMRLHRGRRLNPQDISKRLSLPADLRLPESFLAKQSLSPTLDGPLSRQLRRQSLVTDLNEFSFD
jgi:hypothetical protein